MSADAAERRELSGLHERTSERFERTLAAVGVAPGCGDGCDACCVDGLTVWQLEADAVVDWLLRDATMAHRQAFRPGPEGACVFLREGSCQVYPVRPYVCRSQGAVLRWYEADGDDADGDDAVERRDTCPVHLRDVSLARLPDAALFDIGPAEADLAALASRQLGALGGRGLPQRVGLRALGMDLALKVASAANGGSKTNGR